MKASKIALFLLIFLTANIFFSACGKKYKPRVKYKPEVSDIKIDIEVLRLDLDLLSLDTANISEGIEKLKEKYGDFVKTFFVDILNDGRPQPLEQIAIAFLSIPETRQLGDSIKKTYPDLKFFEHSIAFLRSIRSIGSSLQFNHFKAHLAKVYQPFLLI